MASFTVVATYEVYPPITSTYQVIGALVELGGPGNSTPLQTIYTTHTATTTISASTRAVLETLPITAVLPPTITATISMSNAPLPSCVSMNLPGGLLPTCAFSTFYTSPVVGGNHGVPPTQLTSTSSATSLLPLPTPTGVIVSNDWSPKTTALVVGLGVPFACAFLAAACIYKRRKIKKNIQRTRARDAAIIERVHPKSITASKVAIPIDRTTIVHLTGDPPLPPNPPSTLGSATSPVISAPRRVELAGDPGHRLAPARPDRPRSVSESILQDMHDVEMERGSMHSDAIQFLKLNSLTSTSDNGSAKFIPNTDGTPIHDGTRHKFMKATLDRGLPLDTLARPSLRVPSGPSSAQEEEFHRRSAPIHTVPEVLKVLKRAATDAKGNRPRSHNVNNFEGHAFEKQSSIPSQDKIVTGAQPETHIPKAKRPGADNVDSMTGKSPGEMDQITQHRSASLAALEGRSPVLSFVLGDEKSKAEHKEAFAPRVQTPPIRLSGASTSKRHSSAPIADQQMKSSQRDPIADDFAVENWI